MNKSIVYYFKCMLSYDRLFIILRIIKILLYSILTIININIISWLSAIIVSNHSQVKHVEQIFLVIGSMLLAITLTVLLEQIILYRTERIVYRLMNRLVNYSFKFDLYNFENPKFANDLEIKKKYLTEMTTSVIEPIEELMKSIVNSSIAITTIALLTNNLLIVSIVVVVVIVNGILEKRQVKFEMLCWSDIAILNRKFTVATSIVRNTKNAKDIRTSELPDLIVRLYEECSKSLAKLYQKIESFGVKIIFIQTCLIRFQNIIIYIILASIYFTGEINASEFTSLYIASNVFSSNLIAIYGNISKFNEINKFLPNLHDVFISEQKKEYKQSPGVNDPQNLVICNGQYSYPSTSTPCLKKLNISLDLTEDIAVVGENGSGKSTLMKVLFEIYPLDSGTLSVDSKFVKISDNASFVLQDSRLVNISIRKNLLNCSDDDIISVLHKVKSTIVPSEFDLDISQEFSANGKVLSGGEEQKLLIAKALLRKKAIIIFDEPTSNIDPFAQEEIMQTIDNLSITKFMISHHLSYLNNYKQIIVMKDGEIVEFGSYNELVKSNGEFNRLFKISKSLYQ